MREQNFEAVKHQILATEYQGGLLVSIEHRQQ